MSRLNRENAQRALRARADSYTIDHRRKKGPLMIKTIQRFLAREQAPDLQQTERVEEDWLGADAFAFIEPAFALARAALADAAPSSLSEPSPL
jgi:hypothetical protein